MHTGGIYLSTIEQLQLIKVVEKAMANNLVDKQINGIQSVMVIIIYSLSIG